MPCWHISADVIGSSLQLSFGKKIPRKYFLGKKPRHAQFAKYRGEASVLVWCSWRLDGQHVPITSSDEHPAVGAKKLKRLSGAKLESVEIVEPAWDLLLRFSKGLSLRVFCDHVPG